MKLVNELNNSCFWRMTSEITGFDLASRTQIDEEDEASYGY